MRPGCLPPSHWAVLSRPGLSAPQRPHNKDWHIYMLTLLCIGSRITAYTTVLCVPHCQGFQFSPWLPSHCYVVPALACPSLPSSPGLGLGSTCEGWLSPPVSHLCSPASYCQIVILISPRLIPVYLCHRGEQNRPTRWESGCLISNKSFTFVLSWLVAWLPLTRVLTGWDQREWHRLVLIRLMIRLKPPANHVSTVLILHIGSQ